MEGEINGISVAIPPSTSKLWISELGTSLEELSFCDKKRII